ncbi:S26 family signal peptidase [Yoonia sp. SS1-5]|uniref:S26 family signal peptidase n=1 Tax=Yoonia rhodophyticola TaxID=3137370 RepID=A0AAN0NJ39_9RHOB
MSAPHDIGLVRRIASWILLTFGCLCIYFLDHVDIVMNASDSLDEPAFLMLDTPILLHKGAVVSAQMPEPLQVKFSGYHFVKLIGGMPGDEITYDDQGNPCIDDDECFPLFEKDGAPILPAIAPGVIPEDHYALFGTADKSLDSRYATIGLIHADQLLGRGIAVLWAPDWRN